MIPVPGDHPAAENWSIVSGQWEVSDRSLSCRPVDRDGRPVSVGFCEARYALPGLGCRQLRFACDVASPEPHDLALTVDNVWFVLGTNRNRESMLCVDGQAEAFAPVRAQVGRPQRTEVRSEGRDLVFSVDGTEVFRHRMPRLRPFCRVGLLTWSANEYSNVEMAFEDFAGSTGLRRKRSFRLSCAVDFLDDARRCRWTPEMIGQYMGRLKELGVSRVYWEDYVRVLRPDFATDPEVEALARQDMQREPAGVWETFRQGWDEFLVAVEKGHEAGIEVYALLKPFDWHYYDPNNEKGNYYPSHRFLFANQDKTMRRRPRPAEAAPDDAPIRAVRLVGAGDAPLDFDHPDVEVWLSDDNVVYTRFTGPRQTVESVEERPVVDWWTQEVEPPRRVRVLTLTLPDLKARHVAIRCQSAGQSLRNRLYRLVEVMSADGRPIEVTFGIEYVGDLTAPDTAAIKFRWDYNSGVPSATVSGRDVIERFVAIDRGGWLGFTRGAMREPRRDWIALCLAYPEAREWFLTTVRHALDCGADGVDLRPGAHQRCHAWALRNFNPPMIEAYRQRYGVDPSRAPYDRAAFSQLGGEFYDLFVEQAALLCRGRGRRIQHHVFREFDVTPRERGMMNLHMDWRKWIERGWLDAITLKNVSPDTPFFNEVMAAAADFGVEAHACPYLNTVMRTSWRAGPPPADATWRPVLGGYLCSAAERGCDGLILYEGAAFVAGDNDGRVFHLFPEAADVIRQALA